MSCQGGIRLTIRLKQIGLSYFRPEWRFKADFSPYRVAVGAFV